jgi:hypothetical protein
VAVTVDHKKVQSTCSHPSAKAASSMLQTILIVLLILFLLGGVGTLPTWSHSRSWGYGPSGGLSLIGIIILILLILLLAGRL